MRRGRQRLRKACWMSCSNKSNWMLRFVWSAVIDGGGTDVSAATTEAPGLLRTLFEISKQCLHTICCRYTSDTAGQNSDHKKIMLVLLLWKNPDSWLRRDHWSYLWCIKGAMSVQQHFKLTFFFLTFVTCQLLSSDKTITTNGPKGRVSSLRDLAVDFTVDFILTACSMHSIAKYIGMISSVKFHIFPVFFLVNSTTCF